MEFEHRSPSNSLSPWVSIRGAMKEHRTSSLGTELAIVSHVHWTEIDCASTMGQRSICIFYILTIYGRGLEKAFVIEELRVCWMRYRNCYKIPAKFEVLR